MRPCMALFPSLPLPMAQKPGARVACLWHGRQVQLSGGHVKTIGPAAARTPRLIPVLQRHPPAGGGDQETVSKGV